MRITKGQQEKSQELYRELIQRAWKESTFKDELINSPKEVIARVSGEKFIINANIVVEDQTDNDIVYLNLPRKFSLDNFELSDEQLESVSGGDVSSAAVLAAVAVLTLWGGAFAWGYSVGKELAEK